MKDIWQYCLQLLKGIPVRYNLYLFVYVISYCKINLWHVWSFSDRKTYFAVYAPRILCFFIEGNPVWLFWCVKEKNFWNHYDQIGKHVVAYALSCISLLKEIWWLFCKESLRLSKMYIVKNIRRLRSFSTSLFKETPWIFSGTSVSPFLNVILWKH